MQKCITGIQTDLSDQQTGWLDRLYLVCLAYVNILCLVCSYVFHGCCQKRGGCNGQSSASFITGAIVSGGHDNGKPYRNNR